jgi:hypothetical protein
MLQATHHKPFRMLVPHLLGVLMGGYALFNATAAQASLNYYVYEDGPDVSIKATGSLILPQSIGTSTNCFTKHISSSTGSIPLANLCSDLGAMSNYLLSPGAKESLPFYGYYEASKTSGSTPTNFVFGSYLISQIGYGGFFRIAPTYSSGNPIDFTVTFASVSLAQLGFTTPGLYDSWTLLPRVASDPYTANDTINWIVGAPPAAAVPGPVPLIGVAAALGWSRRLRQRIGVAPGIASQADAGRQLGAQPTGDQR